MLKIGRGASKELSESGLLPGLILRYSTGTKNIEPEQLRVNSEQWTGLVQVFAAENALE